MSRQDEEPLQAPERGADCLSAEDLALFQPAFRSLQEAQTAAQNATTVLQQAQVRELQAQGAVQYVVRHLMERYALLPDDQISPDGAIVRAQPKTLDS